jgi:hypothetical protein
MIKSTVLRGGSATKTSIVPIAGRPRSPLVTVLKQQLLFKRSRGYFTCALWNVGQSTCLSKVRYLVYRPLAAFSRGCGKNKFQTIILPIMRVITPDLGHASKLLWTRRRGEKVRTTSLLQGSGLVRIVGQCMWIKELPNVIQTHYQTKSQWVSRADLIQ